MAKNINRRLQYSLYQFLEAKDFTAEQDYHREMRRLHNQLLHTQGVTQGLEVRKKDDNKIKVTSGTAIDGQGREIWLEQDFDVPLTDPKFTGDDQVFVTIAYSESEDKATSGYKQTVGQTEIYTRIQESAEVTADISRSNTASVLLGSFNLKDSKVPGNINDQFSQNRQVASARIAPIVGEISDGGSVVAPDGVSGNWVIFVSIKELILDRGTENFMKSSTIKVSAEQGPNGWTIHCHSQPLVGNLQKGIAHYMLLRK
jgi:hypothetical protein